MVAPLQDTASRALCVPPGGIGTGWTLHVVPFHDSASAEVPALLLDHGATLVRHVKEPGGEWSVLTDPEGNEFDVA